MSVKHFVHDPTCLVTSSLRSLTRSNPSLAFDEKNKVVFLRSGSKPQVQLVSGGGSGHKPSFGGLVGYDFLSAAVAGSIFASPSAEQVHRCISRRIDASQGILVLVMNYTCDGLHFGMAVEKAKASGLNVKMVVIGDDVGVGRSKNGRIGRRGIAGTMLVQKIAGACAAAG
jgi:triose/dihydroxyacetone kinase / FAD-AMP lyase (cyclizing)